MLMETWSIVKRRSLTGQLEMKVWLCGGLMFQRDSWHRYFYLQQYCNKIESGLYMWPLLPVSFGRDEDRVRENEGTYITRTIQLTNSHLE